MHIFGGTYQNAFHDFPVSTTLDILKMRTERHLLRTKPLGMHEMFLNKAANRVIYTNLSVTTHQCTLIHK